MILAENEEKESRYVEGAKFSEDLANILLKEGEQ